MQELKKPKQSETLSKNIQQRPQSHNAIHQKAVKHSVEVSCNTSHPNNTSINSQGHIPTSKTSQNECCYQTSQKKPDLLKKLSLQIQKNRVLDDQIQTTLKQKKLIPDYTKTQIQVKQSPKSIISQTKHNPTPKNQDQFPLKSFTQNEPTTPNICSKTQISTQIQAIEYCPQVSPKQQHKIINLQPQSQLLNSIHSIENHRIIQSSQIKKTSKYEQELDPQTHSYNIPKFEEMIEDLLQKPVLKINTKRLIQKQIQSFWCDDQIGGSTTSIQGENLQVKQYGKVAKSEDFIIGKKLGKGMFGQVFLVQHKETGFICAMKVVNREVLRIQNVQSQFLQQLKLHSYLRHTNIVEIYGYFASQQNICILQQLCTGGQLFDLLIKRRRISQKRTAYYMKQLVQGLRYIHTLDITHRDIKPQNILLESGVVKICDFGWATHSIDNVHKGKCGTPLYLSPEVVKGTSYCQLVDVWGVGLITYELLMGNIPWNIWTQQQIEKIVSDQLTFPQYIPISQNAKDFISRALTKNPEERISILETFIHPFLMGVNPMQYQDQSYSAYGQVTP